LLKKVQEEEYGEEVDQKALDKADQIKLINSIELFRIKALKTAQKNRIKYSYRALKVQQQPVQKEELTEEELIEFEHELRAQDEALYDRGTKLIEHFKQLHK
jgi:predicted transcriptional regulator